MKTPLLPIRRLKLMRPKIRWMAAGLLVIVALGGVTFVPGMKKTATVLPPQYNAPDDLGTFGGNESEGRAISEDYQTVGWAYLSGDRWGDAFATNSDGTLKDLGTLGATPDTSNSSFSLLSDARDISRNDQIVGSAQLAPDANGTTVSHAYLYQQGKMQDITPNAGSAYAEGISPDGTHVSGEMNIMSDQYIVPFIWTAKSGPVNLFTDGCSFRADNSGGGAAYSVNDAGVVVGQAPLEGSLPSSTQTTDVIRHAFRCTPDANGHYSAKDMGPMGTTNTIAYRINNNGVVVGAGDRGFGNGYEAIMWDADNNATRIGAVPTGQSEFNGERSVAYGVNNWDEVVGEFRLPTGGNHAFLYENGVMYDLNNLMPSGSSMVLETAHDINDNGDITGTGVINGQRHAFRLTTNGDLDITPTKVEVTQTIQDMDNSVPLLSGKRTFAVVHVKTDHGGTSEYVSADLYGERNGASLGDPIKAGTFESNTSPEIKIVSNPGRSSMTDNYIFELPESWTGPGDLKLTVKVNQDKRQLETDDTNDTLDSTVTFKQPDTLSLNLLNIGYFANGTYHTARQLDQNLLSSELRRIYPAAINDQWSTLDVGFNPVEKGAPYLNSFLSNLKDGSSFFSSHSDNRVWYGMVDDSAGLMRGQSEPDSAGVASGPAGYTKDRVDGWWDKDNSYADWMGTHEIAHALGEYHAPFCNATPAPGNLSYYPYPDGIIGGPDGHKLRYSGFDAGDSLESNVPQRMLPGYWQDNMTYCPLQWMSDFRYRNLMTDIHKFNGGTVAPKIATTNTSSTQGALLLDGTIDLLADSAQIHYASLLAGQAPAAPSGDSPYHVRLLGQDGSTLADYPFTVSDSSAGSYFGRPVATPPIASWKIRAPFVSGTARIVVYSDVSHKVIGSKDVSAHAPQISGAALSTGSTLPDSGKVTLSWNASDQDGQPLTYTVLYSHNNKTDWQPLAGNLTATSYYMDAGALAGGSQVYFRVIANDGVNTAMVDAGPFSATDKAPEVRLASPANGATYTAGQPVTLQAVAHDLEGGQLADSSYEWVSDKDGKLGTGALASALNLSVGQHVITLTVHDTQGHASTKSVTITIAASATQTGPVLAVDNDLVAITDDGSGKSQDAAIGIRNTGTGGKLFWTVSSDDSRVQPAHQYGTTPNDLILHISTAGLLAGDEYAAHVTVSAPGATSRTLTVHVGSSLGRIDISSGALDFGTQNVGSVSASNEVTLAYHASGSLALGAVHLGGASADDYQIGSDTCANASIPTNGNCKVSITFKPSAEGNRMAYLIIDGQDSADTQYVALSGTGAVSHSTLVGWGSNTYGQLGFTSDASSCFNDYGTRSCTEYVPKVVSSIQDVAAIATGGNFAIAVKEDGTVWAWGNNAQGQLGTGIANSNPIANPTPVQVKGINTPVTKVAADHGSALAVAKDGTVWAWGSDINGQLGDGSTSYSGQPTPHQVKGKDGAGLLSDVVDVAIGTSPTGQGDNAVSMALKSDGTVWTWGSNYAGELGNGTRNDGSSTPVQVLGPDGTGVLTDVKAIAFGMALKKDGTVWTWGDAGAGQLGNGSYARSLTPVEAQDPAGGPLKNIVAIASFREDRYALTSDGHVLAWGANSYSGGGLLGIDSQYDSTALPRPVVDYNSPDGRLSNIRLMAANIGVKADGSVWTWGGYGTNDRGLPIYTYDPSSPSEVAGPDGEGKLKNAVALSTGIGGHMVVIGARAPVQPLTISADSDTVSADEGSTAQLRGTYSTADGQTVQLSASSGTVTDNNGNWQWSQAAVDGPSAEDVTITATRSDGSTAAVSFKLKVLNVPPTIGALIVNPIGVACAGGNDAQLSFAVTDPAGALDPITGMIDWGDGSTSPYTGNTYNGSHHYAPGRYTIKVMANDGDGGITNRSTTAGQVDVLYKTGDFQPPIKTDGSSVFKLGSTIPVKISVADCNGSPVTQAALTVHLDQLDGSKRQVHKVISSSSADSGNTMRVIGSDYMYDLSTKLSQYQDGQYLEAGQYRLTVESPMASSSSVTFQLKP